MAALTYRSRGFETVCALHGFVSEPGPAAAAEQDGPALAFDAAGWARLPLQQLLLRLRLDTRDLGQSPS